MFWMLKNVNKFHNTPLKKQVAYRYSLGKTISQAKNIYNSVWKFSRVVSQSRALGGAHLAELFVALLHVGGLLQRLNGLRFNVRVILPF